MPWLSIGASVGSSLLGSMGSSKAAKRQAQAEADAAALKERMFQEGKQLQMPFYRAGTDALAQLTQRLPELTATYDPSKLLTEPGYQFGLEEGQKALERSLAARGRSVSGAAMTAATRYGNDYATTKLGDAFNRDRTARRDAFDMLQGLSSNGQRAGMAVADAGAQYANGAGQNMVNAADARAANDIAQGNIWGGLLNKGASIFKNMPTGGKSWAGGQGWGTGDAFGNQDLGMFLADGGPVRSEPVVGTRAPARRGSTGGGLSREAILAALDGAVDVTPREPARQPMQPGTIPRVEDALRRSGVGYKDGGAVKGKKPGKADTVPARLSDGEHVIDAEVVAMLGDGNTEAGHALLDELKQRVREFKRRTPADRPAAALGA